MDLFLLRHGDALSSARDDASRPLSPLGERQAAMAGRMLARLGHAPRLILASPLVRAARTAEIVAETLGHPGVETCEYLTPSSDPRQLLEELNRRSMPSVLCVGHLPNLQLAASLIVTGSRDAGLRVGTGTLLSVVTPAQVTYGSGQLAWMVSYEQMRSVLGDAPLGGGTSRER
jgi:phosphohistidine phosphatase